MYQNKLPNATAVLILGIFSILTCWCYGVLGILLAIIALVLANKDMKLYNENPENYSNVSNLKTGRIMAYIGLALSVLFICYVFYVINMIGWETLQDPELLQEKMRELQGL